MFGYQSKGRISLLSDTLGESSADAVMFSNGKRYSPFAKCRREVRGSGRWAAGKMNETGNFAGALEMGY